MAIAISDNRNGKLGLGDVPFIKKHTIIPSLAKETIVNVVLNTCGGFFLGNKGEVWVCGNNEMGELGLGENIKRTNTPTKINNLPFITNIKTSLRSVIFIDENENLYYCGLGLPSNKVGDFTFNPVLVKKKDTYYDLIKNSICTHTSTELNAHEKYVLTEIAPRCILNDINQAEIEEYKLIPSTPRLVSGK